MDKRRPRARKLITSLEEATPTADDRFGKQKVVLQKAIAKVEQAEQWLREAEIADANMTESEREAREEMSRNDPELRGICDVNLQIFDAEPLLGLFDFGDRLLKHHFLLAEPIIRGGSGLLEASDQLPHGLLLVHDS